MYWAVADKGNSNEKLTRTASNSVHSCIYLIDGYQYRVWKESHGKIAVQGMFRLFGGVKNYRRIYLGKETCKEYLTIQ